MAVSRKENRVVASVRTMLRWSLEAAISLERLVDDLRAPLCVGQDAVEGREDLVFKFAQSSVRTFGVDWEVEPGLKRLCFDEALQIAVWKFVGISHPPYNQDAFQQMEQIPFSSPQKSFQTPGNSGNAPIVQHRDLILRPRELPRGIRAVSESAKPKNIGKVLVEC